MSARGPYDKAARSPIAARRLALGLTQREAAQRCCLSLTVYQRAEWSGRASRRATRLLGRLA